jgi:hypothetical protein
MLVFTGVRWGRKVAEGGGVEPPLAWARPRFSKPVRCRSVSLPSWWRPQESNPLRVALQASAFRNARTPDEKWSGRWGSNPQNLHGLNVAPLPKLTTARCLVRARGFEPPFRRLSTGERCQFAYARELVGLLGFEPRNLLLLRQPLCRLATGPLAEEAGVEPAAGFTRWLFSRECALADRPLLRSYTYSVVGDDVAATAVAIDWIAATDMRRQRRRPLAPAEALAR